MKMKGIDVSKWQGAIDFDAVKKNGYKFVIIRAGYGKGNIDPYFERNYQLARRAGLFVGAYWYSYAESVSDARLEMQASIKAYNGKVFDFPVYYDVEEKGQFNRGAKFVNDIIHAYCSGMEKAGFYVGVYMSTYYATKFLYDDTKHRFDMWIAQYNTKCTYEEQHGIWQYKSTGKVNGINGNVDLDVAYKNYPSIMKKGFNGYGK